jgi:hypothetical protein
VRVDAAVAETTVVVIATFWFAAAGHVTESDELTTRVTVDEFK